MQAIKIIIAVGFAGLLAACSNSDRNLPNEGLQIQVNDATNFVATYRVVNTAITVDSTVDGPVTTIKITSMDGVDLAVVEKNDTTESVRMWHAGVELDLENGDKEQPAVSKWLDSVEVQLVASFWRDIVDTPLAEMPAAKAAMEYGIHIDEVLGKMVAIASGDQPLEGYPEEAGHRCTDCAGACGPNCWSIGSLWYCRVHDCCCDHYGSWACYSWCYAYPKCGHSGCY